ncbi:MAG: hypothetical protein PHT07_16910 [Paludibacter sp.]|nr:hypothetical protein [Paludibacter sp.]
MKKTGLLFVMALCQFCLLYGQDAYKQNFLNLFKSLPEIKTCEDSYNFTRCADNSCSAYKTAGESMTAALKELMYAQIAANNSITAASPMGNMTPDQAKALSEKMKKMTPAEKQQWAMQYAQGMMNNDPAAHVNRDMDNTVVNDAVEYITGRLEDEMNVLPNPMEVPDNLIKIENKYQPQKETLLLNFQTSSGITHDPSSSSPYIFGEASDAQIARYNKALSDWKANIAEVYNAEMTEKLSYVMTKTRDLVAKYSTTEEKIGATHYGDDAAETVNKSHLYNAHKTVLERVMGLYNNFDSILKDYSARYTQLKNK